MPARTRRWPWVVAVALASTLLICGGGAVGLATWAAGRGEVDTIGQVAFTNRLAIPPLAPSRLDGSGRRVFDLTARPGRHDFGAGTGQVSTWGFNGAHLGPTLRARRGEQVQVNVRNEVGEPTSTHWHGMHLPAAMDGGPHQLIAPGTTWSPTWRIDQPASTLWYHPHLHGTTERHVYRGLAGMFLIDDDLAGAVDLPHEYGVDDLPLIVQDKKFTGDGELSEDGGIFGGMGVLGDTLAVNGTVGPYHEVTTELVRLRLLNASTGRVFHFGFADDRRFAQIASDGGLLARPYPTTRVQLVPGERAEIVVRMRPGERVVLRSLRPDLGTLGFLDRFFGRSARFDVLELRAAQTLAASPQLPDRLVDVPRLDAGSAARTRSFRLSGTDINGAAMAHGRIDEVVDKDTTEIWEVRNNDGVPHSFHVHDVQFQVLTVDTGAPPGQLAGWKDTIYVRPNTNVRIIMRFADYADPDVPYMYHCHMLAHEDRGMMGQFVVVEPGQRAGSPPHTGHGD